MTGDCSASWGLLGGQDAGGRRGLPRPGRQASDWRRPGSLTSRRFGVDSALMASVHEKVEAP